MVAGGVNSDTFFSHLDYVGFYAVRAIATQPGSINSDYAFTIFTIKRKLAAPIFLYPGLQSDTSLGYTTMTQASGLSRTATVVFSHPLVDFTKDY